MKNKITVKYMVHPARYDDETYKQYKERRTTINKIVKQRLQKGRIFWPSSELSTYKKGML